MGVLNDRFSLLTFGMGAVGVALALRWWQFQKQEPQQPEQAPNLYLPPTASRPPLPPLRASKKRHSSH
jgi:hypothetical protein